MGNQGKEIAVSNTGPVLHLSEIGQEGLLKCFCSLGIPDLVKAEYEAHNVWDKLRHATQETLSVEAVSREELQTQGVKWRSFGLQDADLSVGVLAQRKQPDVVLTDDLKLRQALESEGFTVVGSVGIILRGFSEGRITRPELEEAIDKLLNDSTLYLSRAFRKRIRRILKDMGSL